MRLVLSLILAALTVQPAKAGSAVASDGNGHLSISFGHSKEVDKQSALELGRRLHGPNVRIVAASDVTGYCAIAVATWGRGSVFGLHLAVRREKRLYVWPSNNAGNSAARILRLNQNSEDEGGLGVSRL